MQWISPVSTRNSRGKCEGSGIRIHPRPFLVFNFPFRKNPFFPKYPPKYARTLRSRIDPRWIHPRGRNTNKHFGFQVGKIGSISAGGLVEFRRYPRCYSHLDDAEMGETSLRLQLFPKKLGLVGKRVFFPNCLAIPSALGTILTWEGFPLFSMSSCPTLRIPRFKKFLRDFSAHFLLQLEPSLNCLHFFFVGLVLVFFPTIFEEGLGLSQAGKHGWGFNSSANA